MSHVVRGPAPEPDAPESFFKTNLQPPRPLAYNWFGAVARRRHAGLASCEFVFSPVCWNAPSPISLQPLPLER
jgi:hypothetical protein